MKKIKLFTKLGFLGLVSATFMLASCVGTTNPDNSGTNGTDNGGGQTDSTPSIVLDQTSVTLSDAIPLVTTEQIKATVSNADGATVNWVYDENPSYSVSEDSNSYATITALLGGSGKLTAGIVVNEKAYKASADVTVNLAAAAPSNISVTEDTSSTAEHSFKVTWATPTSSSASETSASSSETSTQNSESSATSGETSSSSSENLSVLKYLVSLYKIDGETSEESLIAFSTLDSSATEKSFSSETSEDYSVEKYSIDSATTYKVKLYCIYSISSTSDETSTTTYSVNEVQVKTATDNSNPDPVSDATMALAEDSSSITLIWTNSADADLASFKITPYIDGTAQDVISLSKADSETNKIDFTASAKNTYTYDLTSSKTDRIFKFTITSYDDAGNPTSLEDENAKYVVSFKTSSDSADSITVAGDTNPPAKVGDLKITIKSISDSNVTYDASWTNPSDSDFDKVLINGEDVGGVISFQNHTVALDDISSGFTVSSVDDAGNENTITVPSELFKSVALNSSIKDEAHFSKALLISDISLGDSSSSSSDYSTVYSVSAIKSDDSDKTIVSTATVSDGKAVIRGLECDTKYSLIAGATYSSSDYVLSFTDKDSDTVALSSVASLVVAEIRQDWKKPLVVPYLTSSVTRTNVIGVGFYDDSTYNYQESDITYTRWLVEPSFTNPTATNEYSFEAAQVTSEGFVASGYFMYLDVKGETSWNDSDKAIRSWGVSAEDTSKALRFAALSSMDDDKKTEASFKEGESTFSGDSSYGTWKVLKVTYNETDYGIFANNFSLFAAKSIDTSKGDYNLAVKTENYTGTSSDVSQSSPNAPTVSSISNTSALISWTDPTNASLSTITVSVKDSSENEIATGTVNAGVQTYSVSGLTKGTAYTVTLTATNIFGTTASSSSTSFTTSSMEAVSDIVVDMFNGTVSWAIPDDDGFTKVTVKVGEGDAVTVNKSDSPNTQATVSGLTAGANLTVTTYATVDSEEKSVATTITLPSSESFASASSATVENHLSGYKVTGLTLPSSVSGTATYAVAALENSKIVSSSAYFTRDTSAFLLGGLTAGKTYSVAALTKIIFDDYTVLYANTTNTANGVAAKTVVWEIHSPWLGNGLIAPYMTSSKTYQNVVQAGYTDTSYSNIEDFTYNAWIVQPALNGDVDSFSLEATVANTGASSGYYMTTGAYNKYSDRNWNISGNVGTGEKWAFSYDYSYYAWVTKDFDDEDTDLMSFKRVENSNYSSSENLDSLKATGWYYITLDKDSNYILWGTCSNMVFVNVSSPTDREYAFYTVEHNFDGTSSSPSQVTYTTEKTATTASITFTISDSDIASYKISTTNTNSSGKSIADVEKSSNLGLMGSHTVEYTGLSRNTPYTFTITVTNASGLSTDTTVSITTDNSYAPTNVTVAPRYTGELYVTWEDDSDATDATYTVKVYESGSSEATKTVSSIASGTKYALIRDLTVGTSYTADVVCAYNSTDYTASSSSSATVVKVTAATIKNHSTSAYIIPNAEGAIYCLSSSSANESYSATWIIHSALDETLTYTYSGGNDKVTGTVNTFSLEATDADGNGTGKYLYISNLSTSNTNATDGTAILVDESSITSSEDYDATKASFFEAYSSWSNSDGSNNSSSMGYYVSIRPTYSDGGFMLGNDTVGNVLKYRYSLNAAGVSNWHWYLDKSTTTSE